MKINLIVVACLICLVLLSIYFAIRPPKPLHDLNGRPDDYGAEWKDQTMEL